MPRSVFAAACVVLSFAGLGRLSAQASPAPITFTSGSWQGTLGGYFKLDLIHDPLGDSGTPRRNAALRRLDARDVQEAALS
jgi:hypothetical protein